MGVAYAQNTSSGTISGQVTDAQGASIAGADVLLLDHATGSVKTFTTNDAGRYNIFNLPPGSYDVGIKKPGFAETRVSRPKRAGGTGSYAERVAAIG